jgi:cobyric acid synthase
MVVSAAADTAKPFIKLDGGTFDGCYKDNVYGTYLHGFFDSAECRRAVLNLLKKIRCRNTGLNPI